MNDPHKLLEEALAAETLLPEDVEAIRAMTFAPDALTVAQLVGAYYRDQDRADRTPRPILYLHLGLLLGALNACIAHIVNGEDHGGSGGTPTAH
jgi:hypothetical protein